MRTCLHEAQKGAGRSLCPHHFQSKTSLLLWWLQGLAWLFQKGGEIFHFPPKGRAVPFLATEPSGAAWFGSSILALGLVQPELLPSVMCRVGVSVLLSLKHPAWGS